MRILTGVLLMSLLIVSAQNMLGSPLQQNEEDNVSPE